MTELNGDGVTNALKVDLEDWYHGIELPRNEWASCEDRLLPVVERLLGAFARALPQALAMGKPCVAVDLDGAPEVVVPGQTGYLVPAEDAGALADAVTMLLADPDLRSRMGAAGRELVDPAFRAETMVTRTSEVYKALTREKSMKLEKIPAENPSGG